MQITVEFDEKELNRVLYAADLPVTDYNVSTLQDLVFQIVMGNADDTLETAEDWITCDPDCASRFETTIAES